MGRAGDLDGLDFSPPPPGVLPDWLAASVEMHRYVNDLVDERRRDPRDDLISELLERL